LAQGSVIPCHKEIFLGGGGWGGGNQLVCGMRTPKRKKSPKLPFGKPKAIKTGRKPCPRGRGTTTKVRSKKKLREKRPLKKEREENTHCKGPGSRRICFHPQRFGRKKGKKTSLKRVPGEGTPHPENPESGNFGKKVRKRKKCGGNN